VNKIPLFTLENVIKKRDSFSLHISKLNIYQGEKIAIIGPSGCGKSTTLDILGMIMRPDAESTTFLFYPHGKSTETALPIDINILWKNNEQDKLATYRLHLLSYVLQTGGLLPYLSVKENIILPLKALNKRNDEAKFNSLLKRLKIQHLANNKPQNISIGERQRVAIARALISSPAVILADEPTAALDPNNADTVMKIFLEEVENTKTTLIMVTHYHELIEKNNFTIIETAIAKDALDKNKTIATIYRE